ncbi:MAG: Sec-independent protein translocase protein TatB [Pseudomonadota bacterium]
MFDFSFGELLVVALVALVVLGPERLPKAARFTGLWVRRARAQWYSVKSELEHELASDELKRSLHDGRQALREAQDHLRGVHEDVANVAQFERAEPLGHVVTDPQPEPSDGTVPPSTTQAPDRNG